MNQSAILSQSQSLTVLLVTWVERLGLLMLLAMPLLMFLGIATCDIAIVVIAGLFVLRSVLLKDFSWLRMRWLQIGLVLWLYMIVISPFAVIEAKLSFRQAIPFVRYLLFAAGLQCWLLAQPRYRRYLMHALGATLIFIAMNAFFSFITGLSLFGKNALQYYPEHHPVMWVWNREFQRLYGINGKFNAGILMAWTCMPFLAFLLSRVKQATQFQDAIAPLLGVLLLTLAVLMTGERMALLETCFGILLMFFLMKSARKVFVGIAAVMVGCGVLLLLFKPGLWDRNVTTIYHSISHWGSHDNAYGNILNAAWDIFLAHPLFGAGLKQYFLLSQTPHYMALNAWNTHVQNVYLEWLTGTGIIGTGLFLGLLFCWCQQFWQQRATLLASSVATGVLIAFILRIWPLASTTSFFFAWGGITFWWMGAWLLALTKTKEAAHG